MRSSEDTGAEPGLDAVPISALGLGWRSAMLSPD